MTPNDIATNWIAMKDFCRCCRSTYHQQQLAQAYLALESRIQKLEAVADAVRDTRIVSNSIGKMGSPEAMLRAWDRLDRALAELERK